MLRDWDNLLKLTRPSPFIFNLFVLFDFIATNDYNKLYFLIFIYIVRYGNHILKHYIIKPIMGNKKYPILGTGTRPKGAKNCGNFINNKPAKTYGMPSGHSQSAGLFVSYYILELMNGDNANKNILIGLLIGLILLVMYSRVKFGCHTIQQVIFGSTLGLLLGGGFYKFIHDEELFTSFPLLRKND